MILDVSDYPSVRAAISIDLVTDSVLPDSVISQPRYLLMALDDVLSSVPRLSDLLEAGTIDRDSSLAVVATEAGYDASQRLMLQAAAITRTAWRLFPDIRQLLQFQAGEVSESYARLDWEARRQWVLNEYSGYISRLNGGDGVPGYLEAVYRFCLVKAK